MVTYGTLNLACFYEAYSRNPSFRPRFKYSHWSLALAGTLGCLIVRLLMDALWAVVALVAMAALYWTIRRAGIRARWGDVRSGVAFERVRRAKRAKQDRGREIAHRVRILEDPGWGRDRIDSPSARQPIPLDCTRPRDRSKRASA